MATEPEHDPALSTALAHHAADPFRLLVESVRDYAIIMLDPALKIMSWNPGAERIYGYKRGEILGQPIARLHREEDLSAGKVQAAYEATLREGRYEEEGLRVRKDGSQFWAIVTITALHDHFGRHIGFAKVTRDITERKLVEEKLRASEARHQTLITALAEMVWRTGPHGEGIEPSPEWTRLTGQTHEQSAGQRWLEALHPNDRAATWERWQTALATGQPYEAAMRIRTPDGSWRHMLARGHPVRDSSGQIKEWVGVLLDVTRLRQAEQAVRESEKRYAALVNNLDGIVWELDPRIWKFLFVSPQAERILGYPISRWYQEDHFWENHIHPDDREQAVNYCLDATRRGVNHAFEYRMIAADGRIVWLHDVVSVETADGQPVAARGVMIDITARKQAEDALRVSEAKYRSIFDHAVEGIFRTTPEGRFLDMNPALAAIYGYSSPAEAMASLTDVGRQLYVDPEIRAEFMRRIEAQGTVSGFEFQIRKRDGSIAWVRESARVVRDHSGAVECYEGTVEDVTKQRLLEAQLRQSQKMEAIGRLAGGVAHDFNNLLTVISGFSEILLTSIPPTDPNREAIKAIQEAGERAAALTRQLLAFSRRSVLEPKVLDLNGVVKETEALLRRLIGEDILLTTVLDPALHRVKVDPGQLTQILMNLAVNARDAMPQGGQLTIETRNFVMDEAYCQLHLGAKPGQYVQLAISDTGCGMTPEVKARVFEPFFTTKEVGKGTGLGLAVVHGIVEQSGGHIEVYSEPGQGTTFKLYFPAVEDQPVTYGADLAAATVPRGSETVLLVEDEESVRGVALFALQTHGYTVLTAKEGKDALRVAEKHHGTIDLLLTDLVMPGMSGRELAEKLALRFPQMKILYMSGYTDDAVIHHGLAQEKVAFVQKPFSPLALVRKVRAVLDEK